MKHNFVCDNEKTISEIINKNIAFLSRASLKTLFKDGEIRLNSIKQKADCAIKKGDIISIFIAKKYITKAEVRVVYSDKNILIVNKPYLMDVENNLLNEVIKEFPSAKPMHRLDRNTQGLVIFSLNENSYNELFSAFKNKKIQKYYYALVNGKFELSGEFSAFLKKNSNTGQVRIFDTPVMGSKKIISAFKPIKYIDDRTLVEVKLITGRTHQIRAHLSHLGFSIVGDSKYNYDKRDKTKFIKLIAYKIIFPSLNAPLNYLSNKEFKIGENFID